MSIDGTSADGNGRDDIYYYTTPERRRRVNRDLLGRMIILGSGTSHGVPMIGCACSVCRSDDPHDRRTRSSAILGLPEGNLLIDTSPDLREQLLRENIGLVHAAVFTHGHADHLLGLDELRIFAVYLKRHLPIYCTAEVEAQIRRVFAYAFDDEVHRFQPGGVPQLKINRIEPGQPFEALGATVTPVPLLHGKTIACGYRIGAVAYCTDAHEVPESSYALLEDLDTLVIDGLRWIPHVSHLSVGQALDVIRRVGPRRAYLTHICHHLGHKETQAELPARVRLAHDGMELKLVERR